MTSLLTIAKTHSMRYRTAIASAEEIELALAWVKGEIRLGQVNKAYGKKHSSGNGLYRVAVALREAYRKGILIVRNK